MRRNAPVPSLIKGYRSDGVEIDQASSRAGQKLTMLGSRIAYFACMFLAVVLATTLLRRRQKTLDIPPFQKLGIALGGLVGATLAAKLPFILGVSPNETLISAWLGDGKTILWALAGGYLGVELAKWSFHVTVSTGDSFAVPVALAIAVGRMGCFLYGCCYGVATNAAWGVRFLNAPDAGTLLRHPTQLYEMLFHASFALVAWSATSASNGSNRSRGNWMLMYLLAYAAFRFFSEFWRPEPLVGAGLTFYQWSSVAIGLGFGTLWILRLRRPAAPDQNSPSESHASPLKEVTPGRGGPLT